MTKPRKRKSRTRTMRVLKPGRYTAKLLRARKMKGRLALVLVWQVEEQVSL